ncbi:N-acetylmuramoyl-L-alanine amidase [Hyphomicrobium sp.]|jgi:N-acetylmuramoyl-L-alanine amidase|uniref:N-acetylmuramoyl-L-alanine amidase n=1 Tax=Hyphomicrobium sp. TaxID=82 RepID=UPI002BE4D3F9|nr:N-acetylmuramoyl-L-alanine amidase [Hyphomicrobium sp.]HVZ04125.1 N-acetylmuramoyl-L-alanine amidase [Hyphomicrobium sp.]
MGSLANRALRCLVAAAAFGALGSHAQAASSAAQIGESQVAIANPTAEPAKSHKVLRTRFVVGLQRDVKYQVFSISHPNRVVIELPDIGIQLPTIDEKTPTGLVRAVRAGLAAPGKTRIVIGVTQPVIVESSNIEQDKNGHYRLAIIIRPAAAVLSNAGIVGFATRPAALGAGGIQPPLPRPAENPAERAARTFRPVIVLDPGHGGYDSGAVKRGTVEKNVVLAFSLVLRDLLKKTGRYKVLMTRDDDTFIPLDDRTKFAERHHANLFIAIHADYSDGGSRARGATIYTLRDRVAKNLERSAKDNAAEHVLSPEEIDTVKKVSDDVGAVRSILTDLAERDLELTHQRTGMFAKTVIENMGESTPMRNEPDQQAAFRVLKTAQFPSVLIELAYVTNQQDAHNLKSDDWREKVAQSIVSAIDNYFSHEIAHLPM